MVYIDWRRRWLDNTYPMWSSEMCIGHSIESNMNYANWRESLLIVTKAYLLAMSFQMFFPFFNFFRWKIKSGTTSCCLSFSLMALQTVVLNLAYSALVCTNKTTTRDARFRAFFLFAFRSFISGQHSSHRRQPFVDVGDGASERLPTGQAVLRLCNNKPSRQGYNA